MTASAAPSTQWHSVTPSTRPLSLSILELTPLALTLSLTLAGPSSAAGPSQPHPPGSAKKKKRQQRPESDDESLDDSETSVCPLPGSWPVQAGNSFKDLLSHGVVVSVNGQPWSRIVAHVSDPDESDTEEEEWEDEWDHAGGRSDEEAEEGVQRRRPRRARFILSAQNAAGVTRRKGRRRERERERDRAVVVVYGLNPGQEYEVELRVIGLGGEEPGRLSYRVPLMKVSNSVLIPPSNLPRSRANSLRSRTPRSRSNSVNIPSEVSTPSETPPPTSIETPSDNETTEARSSLASAVAEKDHLTSQIKEARRSSQRAEAALRQEIDVVRKAVEKAGTLDLRAKQKALALQEQVKQAWAGSETAEKEMAVVEKGMPDLEARMEAVRVELEACKDDLKLARGREDDAKERDRKARQEEEKKLAEVANKMEKLKAKKERREAEKVELERRIEELEKQREEVERRGEEDARRRLGNWDHHDHRHGFGFRPRGGFQSRFPPRQGSGSPTHPTFNPAFRPPAKASPRMGVNASAAPFVPSHFDANAHTTLMPPGMQHRIYLPNAQARPRPTFHPPPSVVAEQAAQQQAKSATSPAFPPLPGSGSASKSNMPSGPSLASIVTKAVLSPTSTLGTRPSPPMQTPTSATPTATHQPNQPGQPNQRVSFASSPHERADFPPLSPTGPWASLNPSIGAKARGDRLERRNSGEVYGQGQGMERTHTPPSAGWGNVSTPSPNLHAPIRKGTE